MGKVTVTLDGDEARLLRSLDKVIQKEKELARSAAKVGDKSAAASAKAAKGHKNMGAAAKKAGRDGVDVLKGSIAAATIAVGALGKAFQLLIGDMEKSEKVGKAAIDSLQANIASAGDIAQFSQIAGGLASLKGAEQLSLAQRNATRAGVRGSLPTADQATIRRLTETAARSTKILGPGAGGQFGSVLGDLTKVAPGLKGDDLQDTALALTQQTGKFGTQLDKQAFKGVSQLIAAGVDPQDSLALILAGAKSQQGSRGLSSLASFAERTRVSKGLGSIGIKGIQAAAADPTTVIDAGSKALLGEFEAGKADLLAAQRGNIFQQQLRAAAADPLLAARAESRRAEVSGEIQRFGESGRALRVGASRDRAVTEAREGGALGKLLSPVAGAIESAAGVLPAEAIQDFLLDMTTNAARGAFTGGGGSGANALGLGIAPSIMEAFTASGAVPSFTTSGAAFARGGGKFNGRSGGVASTSLGGPVANFATAEDALAAVRGPQLEAKRRASLGLGPKQTTEEILESVGGLVAGIDDRSSSTAAVRFALQEGMESIGGNATIEAIKANGREFQSLMRGRAEPGDDT